MVLELIERWSGRRGWVRDDQEIEGKKLRYHGGLSPVYQKVDITKGHTGVGQEYALGKRLTRV